MVHLLEEVFLGQERVFQASLVFAAAREVAPGDGDSVREGDDLLDEVHARERPLVGEEFLLARRAVGHHVGVEVEPAPRHEIRHELAHEPADRLGGGRHEKDLRLLVQFDHGEVDDVAAFG
jgi:hypothetical protein